jgi:hypothetical protein
MAEAKKLYCSVVLTNGIEYMVVVKKGWVETSLKDGFFQALTLDGKPILFGAERINILREVSSEEFEAWKKSLEEYKEKITKDGQES